MQRQERSTRRAMAIAHVSFEDLGSWAGGGLSERGF